MGVEPVAISADSVAELKDFVPKAGYTFPLLSDRGADAIKSYDLLHARAGIDGRDIARPAEFLVDRAGIVRWRNLTPDFRVRARPEQMLAAARSLR
jgi:peroxiredoxin